MIGATSPATGAEEIRFRRPTPEDGKRVHALVDASEALELNTGYAYVLLADHFGADMVIAERGETLLGFVAAYRIPARPDTVFVWQVGVDAAARGLGVASRMLDALLERGPTPPRFLEATVSPDNDASRRLFESCARRHDVPFEWSDGYASHLFHGTHEPEHLVRIGPFTPVPLETGAPS